MGDNHRDADIGAATEYLTFHDHVQFSFWSPPGVVVIKLWDSNFHSLSHFLQILSRSASVFLNSCTENTWYVESFHLYIMANYGACAEWYVWRRFGRYGVSCEEYIYNSSISGKRYLKEDCSPTQAAYTGIKVCEGRGNLKMKAVFI